MSKNNRTNYDMYVDFTYEGDEGSKSEHLVDIPFDIFIEAIRWYFDRNLITLDGKDNDIWNTMIDLNCLDSFAEDEDFINHCKELYKGSSFEEEDYEVFKDDYEFEHNLGQYKEDK